VGSNVQFDWGRFTIAFIVMAAITASIQVVADLHLPNAETTDTPVWWLFGATAALFVATGILAGASIFALRRLREIRRDRHIAVFTTFAARWEGAPMAEALAAEVPYTDETLSDLFAKSNQAPADNPDEERGRQEEARTRLALRRIPDFFEDAVMAAQRGGLDMKLFRDEFGGIAIARWERWHLAVNTMREVEDDLAYVEFERFSEEVRREDAERRARQASGG
jgi:hypothetical protein